MANSNPAFARNPAFSDKGSAVPAVPTPAELQQHLDLPSATPDQMGRMTYEDTVVKTIISFAVLVAGAAIGWVAGIALGDLGLLLVIPFGIVALVLAMVNIFKKKPSPALVLAYAATEGVVVGGISWFYQDFFGHGIVPMALFGTLAIVGVVLALFASGKVRASRRATRIFLVLMFGYLAYSLVNVVLMWTGVANTGYFGIDSQVVHVAGLSFPIGVPLGILVILLACYSLVLDFDSIQQGVRNGAPRAYAWIGAFGIMVTVVWLYFQILRVLALVMGGGRR